jgi:hypothetical protein
LHSPLNRKMWSLLWLREGIPTETLSLREIFLILPNPNLENAWEMAGSIAFLHEMRLAYANLLFPLRNKYDFMFLSHSSINVLLWLKNGCLWFLLNWCSILTNWF